MDGNTIINSVLTTPTITNFTNASHPHSDAAGGGQLDNSALLSGVFSAITGLGAQTQTLDMNTNIISNVVDPTSDQDVATKNYVDTQSGDLTNWKQSVVRATTPSEPLSDPPEGTETVDGVNTTTGERILVKNQSNAEQNGIYIAGPIAWVRSVDMDEEAQFNSATVWVEVGATNADTQWVQTFTVTDVGTDLVNFQKSSSLLIAFLGDQNNFTAENTFSGFRLTSIGDPTDEKDAVSKRYVDTQNGYTQTAGARVASTGNINLGSSTPPGNIDGVPLDDDDRILLKNQTVETQNGLYLTEDANNPQTWSRTTDYNTLAEVNDSVVFIREGTLSGGLTFLQTEVLTAAPGSEDILFAEPDPIGIIGTHLTLTGPTLAVDSSTITSLGTQTSPLNMGNNFINNVEDPLLAQDAATKFYVDTIATALDWKEPVIAATTENNALSGLGTAVDGITLTANDRILVKDQTIEADNGIYVAVSGTWDRSSDANTASELEHATVFVESGDTNHGKAYTQKNTIVDIGTDPVEWMEIFQITPVIAGDGLFFTANTLNVGGTANKIVVNTDSITVGDKVVTTDASYTYDAGFKQLFTPNSTNPGINIGSISADPSSFADGDMWYDFTDEAFRGGRDSIADEFIMAAGDQTITGVKTLGVMGNAGSLVFFADTGADITLVPENITGNFTLELPAITDTLVTGTNSIQLINKVLIEVLRENDSAVVDTLVYVDNSTSGGIFGINRARGTKATPLALVGGDKLGGLEASGHDGSNFADAANITFSATENWTVGNHGGEIIFSTTANGATSTETRLVIENDGTANFATHDIINVRSMEVLRGDGDDESAEYFAKVSDDTIVNTGIFSTLKSRGTKDIPTAVLSGDELGKFRSEGYNGTNFETAAEIQITATENWTATEHGGQIEFSTTADGTTSTIIRFVIENDGTANFATNDIISVGTLNTHTIPSGTDTFALLAATQTLTNKTIDGDDNPISNIDEDSLTVMLGGAGLVLTSNGVGISPSYQSAEFVGPWTANHDAGGFTLDNLGILISDAAIPATTGATRYGNGEIISWRNFGNTGNFTFDFSAADRARFTFPSGASYGFAETFIALNGAQLTTASNVRLNSDEAHILEFQRATGSQSLPYLIGDTQYMYPDGLDVLSQYARIKGFAVNETDTTEEGKLTFEVMTGGSANTEILEINGLGLDVNSHLVSSVLDPVSAQDAATKNYVDLVTSKVTVRVATLTPGDLSLDYEAGQIVDNVALEDLDRILIKNQVDESENGVYIVHLAATPDRASDMETSDEFDNARVFVIEGQFQAGLAFAQIVTNVSVDVDDVIFIPLDNIVGAQPFGYVEVNVPVSDGNAFDIVISTIDTYVVYGTTSWVLPSTNINFTTTTAGVLTYNGNTRSFKVDMWSNANDLGGVGAMDEYVTAIFLNASVHTQSQIRSSRNGGAIAKSFVITLSDGDDLDMRIKNVTATTNAEFSNAGFMLTPLPLTV